MTSVPTADVLDVLELELGDRVAACIQFENDPGWALLFVTTQIESAQLTCPDCDELVEILSSGVKCSNPDCTYWACY